MEKRILTGIKPTGNLHLGNYIGVLRRLKTLQETGDCFIFIADLHALTLPIDPEVLRQNSIDIAAFYLAAGLDPEKATLFLQSSVSAHGEVNAILQNYLYMGELSRMTQFKDISSKMKDSKIGLGIFAYPVLMAGDIILYDADVVPVGEDQTQHVEIARDLVNRFNHRYGEILKMPRAEVSKVGKRIMSLSDPTTKMSKSDPKGDIFLKDDVKVIRKKIMSAVTDLGCEVKYDPENKPGISNLLTIYSCATNTPISELEAKYENSGYGVFKNDVADAVVNLLIPIQEKYNYYLNSKELDEILDNGRDKAAYFARKTLSKMKRKMGINRKK